MTAATMLFASSCSKEQISSNAPVGEQVTVTLTADLGAIESRAISDGLSVNEVAWAIYLHGADKPLPELYGVLPISNKQGTLEVRLVTGKSYDIALFAYYKDGATTEQALGAATPKFYNVDWDNKTIALNYPSPLANDTDERDCFWYVKQNLAVDGPVNETFILTRPLAQLNFGVTKEDTIAAAEAGLVVSQSKIVASTYESFNMFTGECLGQLKEYTFAQNAVPQQVLEVENIDYTYIGTAYLLVDEKETQEVTLTIYNNDANNTQINTLNYSYVPFQRNYRTNILGALLTNPIEFNIVVDERFNEPDFIVKHWDGTTKAVAEVNGTYTVTEPAELAWVAQQVNSGENNFEGKAIVLSVDEDEVIDLNCLNNYLWTPIGNAKNPFKGSFDGNGVIIRNMKVVTPEFAGLFGRVLSDEGIKNVVLEDAVIESSHYAGAVAGHAYADIVGCTVKGLTMNVLPNDTTTRTATYDNGDKAGGIVGYVGEKNGASAGYTISNNTVENATITAYRDLGGIAGAAYIATCEGNTVENATITVDQEINFYGTKKANIGQIVGRLLGGTLGSNTATNVELVYKPIELSYLTVAEFLAMEEGDVEYTLSGTITAVTNTTYGNFYLTDDTGTVLIYGLCSPEGAQKYWAASGAKLGDDIVVKTIRSSYNNAPQGKNAKFVKLVSPGTRAFYNVDPIQVDFLSAGGEEVVSVTTYNTDAAVTATSNNSVFSVSVSGKEVTITAAANELEEKIEGAITINVGDLAPTEVKVTLAAKPAAGTVEGGRDDFGTIAKTSSSYGSSKTTAGWSYVNSAVMGGGNNDNNPIFKSLLGTSTSTKGLTINGKTSAKGKITSPIINTGCHTLSLDYGYCFKETNGVDFQVNILQNGVAVQSYKIQNKSLKQLTAASWTQEILIEGDFQIEITNNSPSKSTSNKDRYTIFNIVWTGYSK